MIGKRGPLIAGVASVVVAVVAIFFLVLPKMHAVTAAQKSLEDARAQQSVLQGQLDVLKADQAAAPEARRRIRKVEAQLPPTIDLQGLIRLLQSSADQAGVELFSVTPGTPTFSEIGYSTMSTNITVTGSYFALDEMLYKLEHFPRAAKVLSIALSPSTSGTSATTDISMQFVVEFYTTDSSAGPGGQPGPDSSSAVTPGA